MKRLLYALMLVLLSGCGTGDGNLFPGTVETEPVRISARVGGHVELVAVEEGSTVDQGQLILRLDQTPCSLSLALAEANLSGARASLETVLAGNRQQQILSAAAAMNQAEALMRQADTDLLRMEELAAAGAVSEQELQSAHTQAVSARAGYNSAVQSYSLAAEGARNSEIEAAEAAVAAAGISVDIALEQLGWTTVTSPVAGTVNTMVARAGENVPAGAMLMTVVNMDSVKVVFYLPEPVLGNVSPGDAVTVSTDGGVAAEGSVTFISEESEFTPSTVETREGRTSLVYRAEAVIPNPDGSLKGGMPVDLRIEGLL